MAEMKTLLVLLVSVLCLREAQGIDGAAYAEALATEGVPRIKFDSTVYDFGVVTQVEMVSGEFRFENVGTAELKLKFIATGNLGKRDSVLKPRDEDTLPFRVNVRSVRGHFEKHITVQTNDPDIPSVNLTAEGVITRVIDADPYQINLGDFPAGRRTNFIVEVRRTDGKPLVISKAEASNPACSVTLAPVQNSTDRMR